MGKNLIRKELFGSGTWTCPAGVTRIRAVLQSTLPSQIYVAGSTIGALTRENDYYFAGFIPSTGTGTNSSSPIIMVGQKHWRSLISRGTDSSSQYGGIDTQGDLYLWGGNNAGQLGDGTITTNSSPTLVVGGYKFVQAAQATAFLNGASSYGIDYTGTLYSWGENIVGQLGSGTLSDRSSPVAVLGGLTWRAVAGGGGGHVVGLTTDGDVYAWGYNGNGQLGVGDVTNRSSPVLVLGGRKAVAVSAGAGNSQNGSSYLLTAAGDIYAWGLNANGQLGVGDVTPRSSPVLVIGSIKWKALSGGRTSLGIAVNGDAYAWGYNASGQLGVGDVTPRSSPVLVLGSIKWVALQAGGSNSAAGISNVGNLYAWGGNGFSQLGVGDNTPRSSPVIVQSGDRYYRTQMTSVIDTIIYNVTPGTAYTYAINTAGTATFDNTTVGVSNNYPISLPLTLVLEYEA